MSHGGKCHQFLFYFVTLFISEDTAGVSSQVSIAVLFNNAKLQHESTKTYPMAIRESFEKIPSVLGLDKEVNFVYKDLNSTICDLGTFLSFMDGILACDVVVLLLSCQCERIFLSYLDVHNIKTVSSCEQPYFTRCSKIHLLHWSNITTGGDRNNRRKPAMFGSNWNQSSRVQLTSAYCWSRAPIVEAEGASVMIQRLNEETQLYLLVPADAYGVEFYQDLFFELQRKKLKLHRTLWLGAESDQENYLQKELKKIADNNITSAGATFVLGFLYPEDFRIKRLVSIARTILGKRLGKILWVFPAVHSDLSSEFPIEEDSHVLAFQEGNLGTISCNHDNQNCALRLVLEKTSRVLKSCWRKYEHNETSAEYSQISSVQEFDRRQKYSVENEECKMIQHSKCSIDVLQLTTNHFIGQINWKRIASWNGDTVQPCSSQEESTNIILSSNIRTVFRVPIVEYFPFIVKHELRGFVTKCPINSLPCYGQHREANNNTVINLADKFCCSGWTVDILIYLTSKLSYEFELYFQAEKLYGVYDNKTGTWNGVIQDILSGKGDISVDLGIRPDRCTALDCSLGYLFDGFNAIIKLGLSKTDGPEEDSFHALVGNFQVFLNPFHLDLLVTVLMIFNVFLFLIWATDKICLSYRNKRRGRKKDKFTLLESTSYVWATAFGRDVGDSKKPLTLSARYLSSWLAFLSLIFVNVYVARLMAEIVKQDPTKLFTSLQDPEILNKNLKLGTVRGSSMEAYFHSTRDRVLKQSFENNIKENLLSSLEDGVEAVKNGILDGFIADTVSLVTILNQDPNCSLSLMGRDFSTNPVGFMFRKGWPWAEEFKLQELSMNENKRNTDFWILKQSYPPCKGPSQEHAQLSAADMSGLYLVLIFAVAYCCFSLVMENILSFLVYRYQNSTDDWNVPHNSHRTPRTNVTATNIN